MRARLTAAVFLCSAWTATAADGPLDVAALLPDMKAGKMICEDPNPQTKTCSSLSTFEVTGPKSFLVSSRVRLDQEGKVVMVAPPAEVKIVNGRGCSVLTAADFEKATFEVNGVAGNDAQNKGMRDRLRPALASVLGQEVCEAYMIKDGKMRSIGYIAGKVAPATESEALWVTKQDGYKIGS